MSKDMSLEFFASPNHLDPKFRTFLEESSSRLCEWIASAESRGPLPNQDLLPAIAPNQSGISSENLLRDLQLIMDGAYQPSHPGSLAHLDPPPLTSSIAADLICAGMNNNLLAHELSPNLTKLEQQICNWFAKKLGYSENAGGVAASGGSLSNLMALVVARNCSNLQNDSNLVIMASEDSHVSLQKSIRIMGLPTNSLRTINTNNEGIMCLKSLESELSKTKKEGKKCMAIVATAGTTIRGAIDPIKGIAEICSSNKIWLHIDGAIGGVFALGKNNIANLDSLNKANSITLNPQKVLGITKTSSLLIMANKSNLHSTFSTDIPYVEQSDKYENGGEIGIQGTRSAEVLKLWLGLRQLGEEGVNNLLEKSIKRRVDFQKMLDNRKLKIITGSLHLLAFNPIKLEPKEIESWSELTRNKLLKEQFMLSRPFHNGSYYLKVVLGNPHTKHSHLERLAYLINNSLLISPYG